VNIVLLGDSTIDNGAYTDGGPAVPDHLAELLGDDGRVTMLAIDGSITEDIVGQLPQVPDDASHVLLSVGGNDAMLQVDVLSAPSSSVSESLATLAGTLDRFDAAYRACLDQVLALDLPTLTCTIYNGAFNLESGEQTVITAALRMFNDVILQAGLDHGLTILDLRRVCTNRDDFANPIELNVVGGRKVATAILEAVRLDVSRESRVVPSPL